MNFTSTLLATATLATAGLSAVGSIMQGKAMQSAEEMNAQVARQEAEAIRRATDFEIERRREEREKLLGRQRALYAKAGVKFSGSPLTVMIDTIADYEMDFAMLRYNSQIGISRTMSEAQYREQLGKSYLTESYIKAGTTLLSTGVNLAYQKWGK